MNGSLRETISIQFPSLVVLKEWDSPFVKRQIHFCSKMKKWSLKESNLLPVVQAWAPRTVRQDWRRRARQLGEGRCGAAVGEAR
jgi:hypothetical protein